MGFDGQSAQIQQILYPQLRILIRLPADNPAETSRAVVIWELSLQIIHVMDNLQGY